MNVAAAGESRGHGRALRVAFAADVHARVDDAERIRALFATVADKADVLVLPGDLTDHGRPEEAEALARGLDGVGVPVVTVLGNHDHECSATEDVSGILQDAGIACLQGTSARVGNVAFVGVKGFGGGFEDRIIRGFGEDTLKAFVRASVQEAESLRTALHAADAPVKVAVTHYSPIEETVLGEPPEIRPFLGTTRLAAAIDEAGAALAVHGHAHHGALAGKTKGGVPVWNVSLPVLREAGRGPYLVLDVG